MHRPKKKRRVMLPVAPSSRKRQLHDPLEQMIADALTDASRPYLCAHENASGLDFNVTDVGVEIEVKQFHTPRTTEQMERANNVIVVVGRKATAHLAKLIRTTASE